ncbi:hypothetical protein NQZ79_g2612 [Umbelopsis isabellina]|nr:hypothetical protein NQZ79_g2612 [Umbelopsis isabellina]
MDYVGVWISTIAQVGLLWSIYHDYIGGLYLFKPISSFGFLVTYIESPHGPAKHGSLIGKGLLFGALGDIMLMFKPDWAFLLGLVSFLLSHICYTLAFVKLGVRWTSAASLIGVASSAAVLSQLLPWLIPNVEADMKVPVLVYVCAIIIMVIASLGSASNSERPLAQVLGAIAFMISDIFVAREKFVVAGFENAGIGLPLYFYAQIAIAYSAWRR